MIYWFLGYGIVVGISVWLFGYLQNDKDLKKLPSLFSVVCKELSCLFVVVCVAATLALSVLSTTTTTRKVLSTDEYFSVKDEDVYIYTKKDNHNVQGYIYPQDIADNPDNVTVTFVEKYNAFGWHLEKGLEIRGKNTH